MPIRKSTIEIPVAGGVDTKTDEKMVNPPAMLDIQNCVFTKHGTLKKRNGYEALGTKDLDGNHLTFVKLGTRLNELFGITDEGLYSYSESAGRWVRQGGYKPLSLSTRRVAESPEAQTQADFDHTSSIEVYAWEDSRGGVYYSVYDRSSGGSLVAPTQLDANGVSPRVVTTPDTESVHIVYIDTSANDLVSVTFTATLFDGSVTDTLLASDVHSNNMLDVCYHPTSGGVVYAYASTANTNKSIKIGFLGSSGQFGPVGKWGSSLTVNTSATPDKTIGINSNGSTTVVTTAIPFAGEGAMAFVLNSTLVGLGFELSSVGSSAVDVNEPPYATTVAFRDNTNKFDVWVSGSPTNDLLKKRSYTGATPDGAAVTLAGKVRVAGHAIQLDSLSSTESTNYVVPLSYNGTRGFQDSYFIADSSGLPVASFLRGYAFDPVDATPLLCPHPSLDHSLVVVSTAKVSVSDEQDNVEFTEPGLTKVALSEATPISLAEMNGSTYTSGGMTWQYDGLAPVEAGFLLIPEVRSSSQATTGGGTLDDTKAYFYNAMFRWTDEQGKQLLSAPFSFSLGPEDGSARTNYSVQDVFNFRFFSTTIDDIDYRFDSLYLTRKLSRSPVYLAGFRTPGNGVLKYKWTDDVAIAPTSLYDELTDYNVTEPDLDASTLGFTINEYDYTNSGELENVAPFGAKYLISHDDRIFYVPNEDQNKVYFSKRPDEFSQPGFNEILYIQAPQDGETITALGVMDNKLVIFKRSKIYLVSGEGPNNLGVGAYTLPRLVSTDTGCKDFRSVVRTPYGLMFQSDKGIYLLNRGEAVEYAGKAVEAYNDQTITAATLIANTNEVRFLSSDERTLVFDYEFGTWTTFTSHEGLDAVIHDGAYHYLRLDGTVYREKPGFFKDASSNIVVKMKTAWIKPQGLQRFWRCSRISFLGEYGSEHDLRLKTAVNYRQQEAYSVVWDPDNALATDVWGGQSVWGGGDTWGTPDELRPDKVYQFRHVPKIQKVESIQFTVEEIPPSDPGQGFELTGIALDVGSYKGVFRLPSAKAT